MARIRGRRSELSARGGNLFDQHAGQSIGFGAAVAFATAGDRTGVLQATLDLLLGVERLRYDVMQQSMLSVDAFDQELAIDLPEDIDWRQPADDALDPVEIEPMAQHVPEECLYVRFGSWQNQVWLKRFAEREGAELAQPGQSPQL